LTQGINTYFENYVSDEAAMIGVKEKGRAIDSAFFSLFSVL